MSDDRLATALMVAIRVHAGQVDKQGEPYLLHVLRVVEAVSDEAKVVAALHDTIEDASIETEVYDNPNFPTLTGEQNAALGALTRIGEPYQRYIEGMARGPSALAREVKLADLRDNLGRIPPISDAPSNEAWAAQWASLRRRYEKAIATLSAAVAEPEEHT